MNTIKENSGNKQYLDILNGKFDEKTAPAVFKYLRKGILSRANSFNESFNRSNTSIERSNTSSVSMQGIINSSKTIKKVSKSAIKTKVDKFVAKERDYCYKGYIKSIAPKFQVPLRKMTEQKQLIQDENTSKKEYKTKEEVVNFHCDFKHVKLNKNTINAIENAPVDLIKLEEKKKEL
ncbi:hypothetical protein GVAV_001355 [Gurleya vavrai]